MKDEGENKKSKLLRNGELIGAECPSSGLKVR